MHGTLKDLVEVKIQNMSFEFEVYCKYIWDLSDIISSEHVEGAGASMS